MKKAGIANFDLRKNPTEYEKRKARELSKKFADVLAHPENYSTIVVDNKTAKQIDISPNKVKTKSGKKTRIYVKSDGKAVKVNRNKSVQVGTRGKDQIIHTYYKGGIDVFDTAKKLFAKLPNYHERLELDDDNKDKIYDLQSEVKKYITVAIGDNMPFHRAMYSEEEFNYYVAEFKPQDAKGRNEAQTQAIKELLIQRMVTVEVYSPGAFDGETVEARKDAVRIYKGIDGNGKKKAGRKNSGN